MLHIEGNIWSGMLQEVEFAHQSSVGVGISEWLSYVRYQLRGRVLRSQNRCEIIVVNFNKEISGIRVLNHKITTRVLGNF